ASFISCMSLLPPSSPPFPYTTLFRSLVRRVAVRIIFRAFRRRPTSLRYSRLRTFDSPRALRYGRDRSVVRAFSTGRRSQRTAGLRGTARPSAKAWLNSLEAEYRHARPVPVIRVRVGKLGKRGLKPLSNPRHRLWQIDAVRGMAVVCMVFYHFMWDMMFFGLYPHDVTSGGWRLFARSVAITFLVLVGVSMVLTAQRKRPAERNRQWLERGAKVFGWGLLISVVTRIFLGEAFVLYGILHLIGTAFLLAPLLWRIRRWTPLLGAGVIAL